MYGFTRVGKSTVLLSRFHTYKGKERLCAFFVSTRPPVNTCHVVQADPGGGYTSVLDERARVGAACLCHVLQLRAGDALCLEHSLHGGDILERRNG